MTKASTILRFVKRHGHFLATLLVILLLNALLVYKYMDIFMPHQKVGYYTLFHKYFQMSGFDNFSHITLSNGRLFYALARHPLYGVVLYPLYWLNEWLMQQTDVDYALPLLAGVNVVAAFLAYLFIYRTLRFIVVKADAVLLTWFFFSLAYVMLAIMVPDHFCLSLMLLSFTLYLSACALHSSRRRPIPFLTSCLLFIATAGISLTNGAKVWTAQLFAQRPLSVIRHLVLPFLVGGAVLLGAYYWQYETIIVPQDRQIEKIEQAVLKKSAKQREAIARHQQLKKEHSGKALAEKGVLSWTDVTTSRWDTAVENLFGESFQLHQDHLLQDTLRNRPVFVSYRSPLQYFIEAFILLLLLFGIWAGRRQRLLWICLSWFALDMFLHMVLGFGINEIYIMTVHWALLLPVAYACLLARLTRSLPRPFSFIPQASALALTRFSILLLTVWLWFYNGSLVVEYCLHQLHFK